MPYFFQKPIIWAVSALLLAAGSGSAQVLSPVYSFSDTNGINPLAGLTEGGAGGCFSSPALALRLVTGLTLLSRRVTRPV